MDDIYDAPEGGPCAASRCEPIGEAAERLLAARKAAPEDAPFLTGPLDW